MTSPSYKLWSLHPHRYQGVMRFGKNSKLAPRFMGPFEISECVGEVAYRLILPTNLVMIHNVFHVSMLRKCVKNLTLIVQPLEIEINDDITYVVRPVRILNRDVKQLRNKSVNLVNVH